MIKFLYAKFSYIGIQIPYIGDFYCNRSINLIMTSKTAPLRYTTQNLVQRIVDR